jgi:hypothetical protein
MSALLSNQISLESEGRVMSDVVEAYQNPDVAVKYGVTGVPATVINEQRTFVGVPNLDKFVDKLLSEGKE